MFELLEPLSRLDQIERPFAAFAERLRVVREANLVETKLQGGTTDLLGAAAPITRVAVVQVIVDSHRLYP